MLIPHAAVSVESRVWCDLSLPALIRVMAANSEAWDAAASLVSDVMLWKEAAEREREKDSTSHYKRCWRPGRCIAIFLAKRVFFFVTEDNSNFFVVIMSFRLECPSYNLHIL